MKFCFGLGLLVPISSVRTVSFTVDIIPTGALGHPLNKINDADSFLLAEGANSIWKGNIWKASPALSHFSPRLKIDCDARRPKTEMSTATTEKWKEVKFTALNLQGGEWTDILTITGILPYVYSLLFVYSFNELFYSPERF